MSKRKPVFAAKKEGGRLRIKAPELYRSFVKGIEEGTELAIRIEEPVYAKTNSQLGYYHAEVVPCAAEGLAEELGYTVDNEMADGILSRAFLTRNRGSNAEYVRSKANLDKSEMSEFIRKCIHLCASRWQIVCRTPEEWKNRWWFD